MHSAKVRETASKGAKEAENQDEDNDIIRGHGRECKRQNEN